MASGHDYLDELLKQIDKIKRKLNESKKASCSNELTDENFEILNNDYECLLSRFTEMEQFVKMKMNVLRIYGIPEKLEEDTKLLVFRLLEEGNMTAVFDQIADCQRKGLKSDFKQRPILVYFLSENAYKYVLENKCRLHDVFVVEDVESEKYIVKKRAIEKFGSSNVCVENGVVVVIMPNGEKKEFYARSQLEKWIKEEQEDTQ